MLSFPDFKEKQLIFVHGSHQKKLQFSNDNLILRDTETNQVQNRISCHKIFALFVIGDTTLTTVLLRKSAFYGFTIILMSRNFRTYSVLGAQTEGNFLLRRKQYNCTEDLEISKHLIRNKTRNQSTLLKEIRSKDIEKESIETIERYCKQIDDVQDIHSLLGIEGFCSKVFFQTYFKHLNWKARRPRTKYDLINLLLDMGYTYLYNFIESHLRLYGFDLYMGVYHKAFYERKSLVCDLVEPFRCIIDKKIRKAYALKQVNEDDFCIRNGQYLPKYKQNEKYTLLFAESIMSCKEKIFKYVQDYYRAFIRTKSIEAFPTFTI